MPAVARADLETLLRTRELDRTLTTTLPCPGSGNEQAVAPTGIAALDRLLDGGFPRGQLSEVVGARSSGRTSVAVAMLAAAIARGNWWHSSMRWTCSILRRLRPPGLTSRACCGCGGRQGRWVPPLPHSPHQPCPPLLIGRSRP